MKIYSFIMVMTVFAFSACDTFLDKKPDISMAVPHTLDDVELLLNDYNSLNTGYPIYGEVGTDDYYITTANWEGASSLDQRNAYIWKDEPYTESTQWQVPYKTVYIANQALEILSGIKNADRDAGYTRNLGTAYFYRAFVFQVLAEIHCPAYSAGTSFTELGLPLKMTAGIDEISRRSTLKETYVQIVSDFSLAALNLPTVEVVKGRPSKASAFAGLARTYLYMGDYEQAYRYSDSCLQISPTLMDFNTLKVTDDLPIPRFNVEVIFPALSANAGILGLNTALMDDQLYKSYEADDLRKGIFFKSNTTPLGSFLYKGSYDKSSGRLFTGITTSEVYLIKAEAACRIGKTGDALLALNTLLKNRWNKVVAFPAIAETNPELLLKKILDERRKELVFRGRRWADLKRLNLDSRFQKVLTRTVGGNTYNLPPNDLRYAYRISETVINLSGMVQNKR